MIACGSFGPGLRTAHDGAFLAQPRPMDGLEIIADRYKVLGGQPLALLDAPRERHPMVTHGVALSIGSVARPDPACLGGPAALAQRVQPAWVSDHLCWTGVQGRELHDLRPLPDTEGALSVVMAKVSRVQDRLGRRILVENVSSCVGSEASTTSEWQFLRAVCEAADCDLPRDIDSIPVSAVNHGFDAMDCLRRLPARRIRQIHLAGHTDHGDHRVDTQDQPMADYRSLPALGAATLGGPLRGWIDEALLSALR